MSSALPPGMTACWVEVSLDRLSANLAIVRRHVGWPRVDVCCVVKANAYGHGAVPVSQFLQSLGVRRFAVATVDQGVELRLNGVDGEILVLTGVPASQEGTAWRHDLTVTAHSTEECRRLEACGLALKAHLKCNTGMNRLGLSPQAFRPALESLRRSRILIGGVYSHFSSSEEGDEAFTREQIESFENTTRGLGCGERHLANSAGLRFSEAWFDFVRIGLLLYGYNPSPLHLPLAVRPALSWKVRALQIETLPAGSPISYSRTFLTRRPTRAATLPVGYADGFFRKFSNSGCVLAGDQSCPVLGNVTMDMTVVDVTDAEAGMETEFAVLNDRRNASTLAAELDTIPWEVLCAIGPRVPRVYV